MATQIANIHGNSTTSLSHNCIDAITTTNITQTVWFSILVPQNKSLNITLEFDCVKSDYSLSYGGTVMGKFTRGTGNITKQGTPNVNTLNTLIGVASITMDENTSTQSIDVKVTGILATTLVWSGHFDVVFNT